MTFNTFSDDEETSLPPELEHLVFGIRPPKTIFNDKRKATQLFNKALNKMKKEREATQLKKNRSSQKGRSIAIQI